MVAFEHKESSISCFLPLTKGRIMAKVVGKPGAKTAGSDGRGLANLNLKVTEDERWAFKEWCVMHRVSQVDGFRRAFELLKRHGKEDECAQDTSVEEPRN